MAKKKSSKPRYISTDQPVVVHTVSGMVLNVYSYENYEQLGEDLPALVKHIGVQKDEIEAVLEDLDIKDCADWGNAENLQVCFPCKLKR